MTDDNVIKLAQPGTFTDLRTEILRRRGESAARARSREGSGGIPGTI